MNAPFDWTEHNLRQAQIAADLFESIDRWRKAAEALARPVRQPDWAANGCFPDDPRN